jgi:hypothetical protein
MNGMMPKLCQGLYGLSHSFSHAPRHNAHAPCSSSSDVDDEGNPAPPLKQKRRRKKRKQLRWSLESVEKVNGVVENEDVAVKEEAGVVASSEVCSRKEVAVWAPVNFSLDSVVHPLPNFFGQNHPFMTEMEKAAEKERLGHFEARIWSLKKDYAGEIEAFKTAQSLSLTGTAPPSPHKVNGERERVNGKVGSPRGTKRKHSTGLGQEDDDNDSAVRRSKRSRLSAEKYQHLLDSFPRHMPKPQPPDPPAQRWRWKSVVDQLRYGEKFQIQARRLAVGSHYEFLIHWDE